MLQPYAWRRQLWRMAFFYAPFALVGWLTNTLALCLLAATVLHLGWHYRFQKRLSDWLWHDRSLVPPTAAAAGSTSSTASTSCSSATGPAAASWRASSAAFEGAEALPDAAVVFRTDGSILWCNRLAEQLLGFRWPEDAGQHIGNLIRNPAFGAYLGKGQYDEPFEMTSPINEEKFLEFRIMPYAEDQAMLVVRDVTRLRSLEKTRKHFVSNVSHELRTPLTVLKGYLEMTEEPPPPAMWAKAHKVMMEQTIRMDNLVNQLLTLSRIEAAPTVDLPPGGHARHAGAAGARGAGAFRRAGPPDRVHGTAQSVGARRSGSVAQRRLQPGLQRHPLHPGGTQDHGGVAQAGAMALFAVQDEGRIPPEHLARLTERFYRVDKARSRHTGGSGLGLAIVKHALSHHDCQLDIESRVGLGSRFSFLIPGRMVVVK